MHIITTPKGTFFLADTLINRHPNTETLVDIAKLSNETLKFFAQEPKIAMLSYSNFGADKVGSPALVHEAVSIMQKEYPDLAIDTHLPQPQLGKLGIQAVARNGYRKLYRPDTNGS